MNGLVRFLSLWLVLMFLALGSHSNPMGSTNSYALRTQEEWHE